MYQRFIYDEMPGAFNVMLNNSYYNEQQTPQSLNDPNNIIGNYEISIKSILVLVDALIHASKDDTKRLFNTYKANLNRVLGNINQLRTSTKAIYDVLIDNSPNGPGIGGLTRINPINGHVELVFASGSETTGAVGHEISHAIQYENLQISLRRDGTAGALADITDEIDAYIIQSGSELNWGSVISPPIVNENYVRRIVLSSSRGDEKPYLNFPAGPVNGLNADGSSTTQLQQLKDDAYVSGLLNTSMYDYYLGWEVDYQRGQRDREILKILEDEDFHKPLLVPFIKDKEGKDKIFKKL